MNRLHIAIVGRVNAGKSSLLNLLIGQDVSITSPLEGTTTDVVEKHQELQPLGPITWLDTAGFGDNSSLGEKRNAKTLKALDKTDVAILVYNEWESVESEILQQLEQRKIPVIKYKNINIKRDELLNKLKQELIKIAPDEFINNPKMLGDLAPQDSTIVLVIPIDFEAPRGRLIMPQVMAIRDCLDSNHMVVVTKEDKYQEALKFNPSLVVCDSQVVKEIAKQTPKDLKLTTFSTLMARLKGDVKKFTEGAKTIDNFQDGDKILIAESCTHHAMEDDIGKVKIPRWLKEKTGKDLIIDFCSGHDFPENLKDYKLVIQCGGCMFNRREILTRIAKCEEKNVPITNYGIIISKLHDVLDKVLEPFGEDKC